MLNELKRRGYRTVGESARIIIDSEQVHEEMTLRLAKGRGGRGSLVIKDKTKYDRKKR